MKIQSLFLLCILGALFGCNGQNATHPPHADARTNVPAVTPADTVNGTGKNIMVIYQDRKGDYWFGSWEDGLYRYNGKFFLHYSLRQGLPSNRVEEIREDNAGNLFFNTTGGLCRFNGSSFTRLTEIQGTDRDWKLTPGDLWFKSLSYSGHVLHYDGRNLVRLKLPSNALGDAFVAANPNGFSPYGVYCVYRDRSGSVWFGTAVLGALCFDGNGFHWISEPDVTELHNGPSNGVRSIVEDRDGYFWFTTEFRYEILNHPSPATSFYKKHTGIGSLDGDPTGDNKEYLSSLRDNDGNIWIATYRDGVWQYDGRQIHHYPVLENGVQIQIYCIYKDNSGNLWLGTHENGVYRWTGSGFERFRG